METFNTHFLLHKPMKEGGGSETLCIHNTFVRRHRYCMYILFIRYSSSIFLPQILQSNYNLTVIDKEFGELVYILARQGVYRDVWRFWWRWCQAAVVMDAAACAVIKGSVQRKLRPMSLYIIRKLFTRQKKTGPCKVR